MSDAVDRLLEKIAADDKQDAKKDKNVINIDPMGDYVSEEYEGEGVFHD